MASWPSISNPSSIDEKIIKLAHRTNADINGYVHFRPKWTTSKKSFQLKWNVISSADKTTLETFFNANQGLTFTWTHPETSTVYTCIFDIDEIEFNGIFEGFWSTSVSMMEQ